MSIHDVLILGSGFGGSLLALMLASRGQTVALVDRHRHPRFAIGESSTPLADAMLSEIAHEYELPWLASLSCYGRWKQEHPELTCGLKRGFTYFGHRPGQDMDAGDFRARRMLAAASHSDESSDTHWLRSDVDHFLFRRAQQSGVDCFEECRYELRQTDDGWLFEGVSGEDALVRIRSRFAVDATGSPRCLLKLLQIPDQTSKLQTHSAAVYGHFADLAECDSELQARGITTTGFPFRCDAAAVHHVLDNGWMWQLRFDDRTVSAGFCFNGRTTDSAGLFSEPPETIWNTQLERFPFLVSQFRRARIVRPAGGLQWIPRLQRLATCVAGTTWAGLPATAGFIDPLHSTGIAHTLAGILRLAEILTTSVSGELRSARLSSYSDQVIEELCCVDELVAGCYAALPSFELWCDWTMLYFAAVTSMEQGGAASGGGGFLRAHDAPFRALLREARRRRPSLAADDIAAHQHWRNWLRVELEPWNVCGLLDTTADGLYASTVAPQRPC